MGLDWLPLGKPKPGHEAEFDELYEEIFLDRNQDPSLAVHMEEIEITPYETLGAPRVAFDAAADAWAMKQYRRRKWKRLFTSRRKWMKIFHGYYVLDLVPENDGIPIYSNGGTGSYCPAFTFRAKFLETCEDVLGAELLGEAWLHHTAAELVVYGEQLRERAALFARKRGVTAVLGQRDVPDSVTEWDDPIVLAHIVDSAARWCLFWSQRGHGLHAYF